MVAMYPFVGEANDELNFDIGEQFELYVVSTHLSCEPVVPSLACVEHDSICNYVYYQSDLGVIATASGTAHFIVARFLCSVTSVLANVTDRTRGN